ncbi:MAG: glycosyltransferase family 39 protein [Elusimicrobia bacterium]|nr:glycosyltransferase family 39 protein [Elusimicrobiota bacterium]
MSRAPAVLLSHVPAGALGSRRWRAIWIILAGALALRWGMAAATEFWPIFPDYYYTDARLYDEDAVKLLESRHKNPKALAPLSPGREVYTCWIAWLYGLFGFVPLLPKLLNAIMGVLAIWLLARLARKAAGEEAALLSAGFLALWPSMAFYMSQNLKESFTLLFVTAAFSLGLDCVGAEESSIRLRPASFWRPAAAGAALFMVGVFRTHLLPFVAVSLLAGAGAWLLLRPRTSSNWARAAAFAACIVFVSAVHKPGLSMVLKWLSVQPIEYSVPFLRGITPKEYSVSLLRGITPKEEKAGFLSPGWISRFRKLRQTSDRAWAWQHSRRVIQSQLFPDEEFQTWPELIAFAPKAAFYTLLMPLPGFYPLGNLGRSLAAAENLVLAGALLLALAGLTARWDRAAGIPLLTFFLLTWLVWSLFEFDLGSATRHKLVYFPFILPFAAAGLRLLMRKLPRHSPSSAS